MSSYKRGRTSIGRCGKKRQRGTRNTNPIKFGRCIKALEEFYGIRNGSAGGNGSNQYRVLDPTLSDGAKSLEVTLSPLLRSGAMSDSNNDNNDNINMIAIIIIFILVSLFTKLMGWV